MLNIGGSLLLRFTDSNPNQLIHTFITQSGDADNLTAHCLSKGIEVQNIAVFLYHVHHVDRHNDRNAKFLQLCGEIEVSLEVCSVNDIHNRIRTVVNQIVSGNNFFQCIGRKRINTGKVGDGHILMSS